MVLKTLLLAYLLHLLPYTHGWSIVTSRPVVVEPEPEARLMSFEDIYSQKDTFRLNDEEMGLTALKDKKLVSCFVNDYDPYWLPGPSDKLYIIRNQPCDKVNKNTDFTTLKMKAGSKIASMCRDLYVFWLAARNMGPPPLPGMFPQQQSRDCPYDDDLLAPPMLEDGAPPMIHDGAPPMIGDGAPPMIHDGAPPMKRDGAPPVIHDDAPLMMQESASRTSNDGAAPMLDDGAPPMLREGAPPMSRDEEPPMIDDGAPPMLQSGVQPMFNDGEMRPPLIEKSHSRRDLDAPPSLAAVLKKMMKKNKETDIVAPPAQDMKTPPPPNQFRRNI
ncbi:circumsporozoite protein-like [Mercenaria mercenaria]|uniref:circumsporozoite protein-like n=1 Tax=Mercenaria mercenaria TaxID=6596 RepID=UPI00234F2EBF|nr:circumsporozoite protein-like [Mercenaria mercenaria]